jgi:hypothetical protein
MANVLSKSNIITGEQVDAWNITQSIDAFTGEVDYDITVSGSFTLTGSLNMNGNMYGDTLGSSSYSPTSSYALNVDLTVSSSLANFNKKNTFTIELFQPNTELVDSGKYYIGTGETPGSRHIGVVLPIDCYLVETFMSANTEITGSNEDARVRLYVNGVSSFSFVESLFYDTPYYSFREKVLQFYTASTRLNIEVEMDATIATLPQGVSHNVVFTLLPYDPTI